MRLTTLRFTDFVPRCRSQEQDDAKLAYALQMQNGGAGVAAAFGSSKPRCPFGSRCYRKNREHME